MTKVQEARDRIRLTEAYKDHSAGLKHRSYFKLQDRALGSDLVQMTFIKTWKYLVRGGKIDTMKAFLYHILNNLIVDEYRKRKPVSLDLLLQKGFEPVVQPPEKMFDGPETDSVLSLVKQLPVKYQKILRMRYTEDLTLKEIADKTGQTKNGISVQMHRALEQLKALHAAEIKNQK